MAVVNLVKASVGMDLGLDSVNGLQELLKDRLAVLGECGLDLDALLLSLDFDTVCCLVR